MKIAFLGTGLMGAHMARRLAGSHGVTVWNRSPEKAQALADVAQVVPSPEAAAKGADCVIAMVMDGAAARAVFTDAAFEAAAPGAVFIDMGSVDPATDVALAARAEALGRRYVDAPVSGGTVGAEAGTLAILAGGTQDAFDAVRPVLEMMGRPTLLGPSGSGQVAKLANQLIVAVTIGAVAEALRLAEAGGCDPGALRTALKGGFADSRILDLHGARMVAGDFTPGGRSTAQIKDLDNAMAVAREAGLDLPLSQTVTAAFRDFVDNHDGGDKDHAAYYEWLALRKS